MQLQIKNGNLHIIPETTKELMELINRYFTKKRISSDRLPIRKTRKWTLPRKLYTPEDLQMILSELNSDPDKERASRKLSGTIGHTPAAILSQYWILTSDSDWAKRARERRNINLDSKQTKLPF